MQGGVRCSAFVLLCALALGGCRSRANDYPDAYREFAYVTNGKSDSVTVIDALHFRKLKDVKVGDGPTGIAANPVKNEIYAVNSGSNSVSVIDAEKNDVVATIATGAKPYFIDVSANGERAVVANSGENTVSLLDLTARKSIATFNVGGAPGIARLAQKADVAVVAEREGNSISVIDTAAMKVRTRSLPVCSQPTDVVVMPDGSKAFVACSGSAQVAVVALGEPASEPISATPPRRSKSTAAAEAAVSDKLLVLLPVGATPVKLAMKPDTGEIFVANFGAESISEIMTGANEVGGTYMIGRQPVENIVSRDNSVLYVSNFGSDDVAIYSVDNGRVAATVHVGRRPDALALSMNQSFLFVADTLSNDVAVVRTRAAQTSRPSLFTMIPVGEQPNAIAIKGFTLHQ